MFLLFNVNETKQVLILALTLGRNQDNIDLEIVSKLKSMLDDFNVHAKSFRMARERYRNQPFDDLKLRLIAYSTKDGRIYNVPNVSEVTALIVGDVDTASGRDIIMEKQSGKLQRINELHTSYLGFQYGLLFPYGENGYRHDVNHRDRPRVNQKRNRLTIRSDFVSGYKEDTQKH